MIFRLGTQQGLYKNPSVTDLKESFDFSGIAALDVSKYPREVPNWKNAIDTFRLSLIELIRKLMYAFADYLDLEDKKYFMKQHKSLLNDPSIPSHNIVRTNYYFPIDSDMVGKEHLRLAEHCDMNTFSLLVQDDAGGLEAKMPDGDWIPVPPMKDSIVLNLGFMMEVWTGGNLPATVNSLLLIISVND